MMQNGHDEAISRVDHGDTEVPPKRVLRSAELLDGQTEVLIDHRGEIYRLRETRNGKLILGK